MFRAKVMCETIKFSTILAWVTGNQLKALFHLYLGGAKVILLQSFVR